MTEYESNIDETSYQFTHALLNPASPCYLHPDENPTQVLASPVLSGSNYNSWARAMKTALVIKNKFGFVDGSIVAPSPTDPLYPMWERCNALVMAWITRSVSATIARSIVWINHADDLWDDLKDRFSRGDMFRVAQLLEEIYAIKQGQLSISEYFSKLDLIWNELIDLRPIPYCDCSSKCSCGFIEKMGQYQEQDYVLRFLRGLDDRYSAIRTQIMFVGKIQSVNKVFSVVLQQQQEINQLNKANMNHHQNFSQNSYGNSAITKQCTYWFNRIKILLFKLQKAWLPSWFQVLK